MGALAGMMLGMGQMAQQQNERAFEMDLQKRKNQVDTLKYLVDVLPSKGSTQALQLLLEAQSSRPDKKMSKQWLDQYNNLLQVTTNFSALKEQDAKQQTQQEAQQYLQSANRQATYGAANNPQTSNPFGANLPGITRGMGVQPTPIPEPPTAEPATGGMTPTQRGISNYMVGEGPIAERQAEDAYRQTLTEVDRAAQVENTKFSIALQRKQAMWDQFRSSPTYNNLSPTQKAQAEFSALFGMSLPNESRALSNMLPKPVDIMYNGKPTKAVQMSEPSTGFPYYLDLTGQPLDPALVQGEKPRADTNTMLDKMAGYVHYASTHPELKLDPSKGDEWPIEHQGKARTEYTEYTSGGLYQVMGPGGPTYARKAEALGQPAVKTTYTATGEPTTGGVTGISTTPPPAVPATITDRMSGLNFAINEFTDVERMLQNPQFTTLGPALGRIKLSEIDKLGGLGATPEQIELAVRLANLLTIQAFARGGKQLTGTELNRFEKFTPSMNDTLQQAIIKSRQAINVLKSERQTYYDSLPARVKNQLEAPVNIPPPPTSSSLQVGTVEDGYRYTGGDPSNPSSWEKVQ